MFWFFQDGISFLVFCYLHEIPVFCEVGKEDFVTYHLGTILTSLELYSLLIYFLWFDSLITYHILCPVKCDCKIDWLWVRSPLEEVKYLFTFIFSFISPSVMAKHSVELRHSTRNATRIRLKVGNGVSLH